MIPEWGLAEAGLRKSRRLSQTRHLHKHRFFTVVPIRNLGFVVLLTLLSKVAGAADSTGAAVYRLLSGSTEGQEIWIVDGAAVRRSIYPEFLYGGNSERYLFIPKGEIWIDNAIAAEEFAYTVAHELHERTLMATRGDSYDDAHNSALAVERTMRQRDQVLAHRHEVALPRVSPTDCDGVKGITGLPDSLRLRHVYRALDTVRDGLTVWIVDGAAVRRDVFPDFGLSGNDRAYRFIPKGEIWIDDQISCEETEFSVATELIERTLMGEGVPYNEAYEQALARVLDLRIGHAHRAAEKPRIVRPDRSDREVGTGSERRD